MSIDKTKIKEFVAYAKICSSKLAYNYVLLTNNGKDTSSDLMKLRLLRSYIKTVESCAGIKRTALLTGDCNCESFCMKTCLSSTEICKLVNKIKSICKTC